MKVNRSPLWTFKKLPFCQIKGVHTGYVIKLSTEIKAFGRKKTVLESSQAKLDLGESFFCFYKMPYQLSTE